MDNKDQNSRPRRGRPPGANRQPLSQDERKARNAYYEKQRREIIGAGISRLEPLVGATPSTPRGEVLARAVCYITTARDSIESLRDQNLRLMERIAECQRRERALQRLNAEAMSSRAPILHHDQGEGSGQVVAPLPDPVLQAEPQIFNAEPEPDALAMPVRPRTPEAQIPGLWLEDSPPSSSSNPDYEPIMDEDTLASCLFPGLITLDPGDCKEYEDPPPD